MSIIRFVLSAYLSKSYKVVLDSIRAGRLATLHIADRSIG